MKDATIKLIARLLKKFVFYALYKDAADGDRRPLDENTAKHATVILRSLIVIPGCILAIKYGGETAEKIIFYVSIAAQIAGLAWFVISFAALPTRHNRAAMIITETMLCSFLGGVYSMETFAAMTAPWALLVITPIYWWLYKAAVIYDSADLLKIGKDEEELKAAVATQQILAVLLAIATSMEVDVDEMNE